MRTISVLRAEKKHIASFHACLDSVAREKIYIEMIEAPPLPKIIEFQSKLIDSALPVVYALDGNEVVGWCDVSRPENPRLAHRGFVGMGLKAGYRGRGLGTRLLMMAIEQAQETELEKLELTVYASNTKAIALYERCGFTRDGVIENYRKLEGQSFDCILMSRGL